jgi:hypothetical protein
MKPSEIIINLASKYDKAKAVKSWPKDPFIWAILVYLNILDKNKNEKQSFGYRVHEDSLKEIDND